MAGGADKNVRFARHAAATVRLRNHRVQTGTRTTKPLDRRGRAVAEFPKWWQIGLIDKVWGQH